MKDVSIDSVIAWGLLLLRYILSGIFLRSGLTKALDPTGFRKAMAGYKLVPQRLLIPMAISVMMTEGICGVLLALGIYTSLVAYVLAALLMAFSAAISTNLVRGRVIDCGCGGSNVAIPISWRHVVADIVMAASAVAIAIAPPRELILLSGPGGVLSVPTPAGTGLTAVLAAMICLVVVPTIRAALALRKPFLTLQKRATSSELGG